MVDRRRFIASAAALGGASLLGLGAGAPAHATAPTAPAASLPGAKPRVISTWDFGIPANQAAWRVLAAGGHALDAVE